MAKTSATTLSVIPGCAGSPAIPDADLVDAILNFVEAKLAPMREKILLQETEIKTLKATPREGIGLAGGFIDRSGNLVLTASDGTCRVLDVVVGRDGKDGEPGLGFDDLTVERIHERRIVLKFVRGDRVKEFPVDIPAVVYRDVYKSEMTYQVGDLVTWAGGLWHCNWSDPGKPGQGNPAWTLCTKAGRDGRDGRSAFEVAKERGFKGSEDDWLKSLRGPPGKDGKLLP